ncbi:hypothetical protein BS47DRAFT_1368296 [Hydnum rufescens UP504]|uniref:Uncharacterized protein n=1 Tax=Hydnum rufescens UP504 TaxID=1448309 RepID=A0A9P6DNC5_9AGAM|nr:hypothetical protein BS47DRAFT_1368296 [Hydnum rufescens UP504]
MHIIYSGTALLIYSPWGPWWPLWANLDGLRGTQVLIQWPLRTASKGLISNPNNMDLVFITTSLTSHIIRMTLMKEGLDRHPAIKLSLGLTSQGSATSLREISPRDAILRHVGLSDIGLSDLRLSDLGLSNIAG